MVDDVCVFNGWTYATDRILRYAMPKIRRDRQPAEILGCERHLG